MSELGRGSWFWSESLNEDKKDSLGATRPHALSPLSSYLSIYEISPATGKGKLPVCKWVTSNESPSFQCKINVTYCSRLQYPIVLKTLPGNFHRGCPQMSIIVVMIMMMIMVPFFFLLTSSIWLPFRYIRLQARRLSIWCRGFYSATRFWFLASSKELETCRSQVWNFQTRHSAVGDREQEARSQRNKAFDWKVVQFQMYDSKRVRRSPPGAGTKRCCQRHYQLV